MAEVKPVGRPTVYDQELYDQALDYLETYNTKHKDEFPSVVGLCRALNRARSLLYKWADPDSDCYHPEFKDILRTVMDIQQQELLNKGVNGGFNPTITKLILTKHGYHDKQDNYVKEFNVNIGSKDADTL